MNEHQTKLIVLAAGKGSRMKSEKPKVIHEVSERPMVEHIIRAAKEAGIQDIYMVVGHKAEEIKEAVDEDVKYVTQSEQLGTAHAVKMASQKLLNEKGDVIIVTGDTPLITKETFTKIINEKRRKNTQGLVVTATVENPFGYGRILVDKATSKVKAIREEKDASKKEKKIKMINTGIFCFSISALNETIDLIGNENNQNEYYLTDAVGIFYEQGKEMASMEIDDPNEIIGVNDKAQLAEVEKQMRKRINKIHMENGVTMIDPEQTYIGVDVEIGEDTILMPGVTLSGKTSIGSGCRIESGSVIKNSVIGNDTIIKQSVVTESVIRNNVTVGPFAHLRPNSLIENDAKIGNFVETKSATIGKRSKASHLSYIGDATVGEDVNIGCGVITANYDGKEKHRTTISDGVFVGSNSNLVAPVVLGKDSFVAAGSTITEDVPEGQMAIARERQTNKERGKKKAYKMV